VGEVQFVAVLRQFARFGLCLLLVCARSVLAQDQAQVDVVQAERTAAVAVDGVALFRVAGSASFPSEQRAHDISERIAAAARDPAVSIQDIHIQPQTSRIDIVAEKRHILAVVDRDAELDGLSITDSAQFRTAKIHEAITRYRAERTSDYLLRAALNALSALIATSLAIFLLVKSFQLVRRTIERRYGERVRSLTVSSFELVRAETIWRGIRTIISAVEKNQVKNKHKLKIKSKEINS